MYHKKPKRPDPYKAANEAFLEVKSKEEGIVVLDNGVLYKVLEEGYGAMKMDDIPAHSTLIFKLQLVKIER